MSSYTLTVNVVELDRNSNHHFLYATHYRCEVQYSTKNSLLISLLSHTLSHRLAVSSLDDETGEAEDHDTATDDGETEVVEHHGTGLHQVPHHHGEDLGS